MKIEKFPYYMKETTSKNPFFVFIVSFQLK